MRFCGAILSFGKRRNKEYVQIVNSLQSDKYFYFQKSCIFVLVRQKSHSNDANSHFNYASFYERDAYFHVMQGISKTRKLRGLKYKNNVSNNSGYFFLKILLENKCRLFIV